MSDVPPDCPFCVDNGKVELIAWSSADDYYMIKAHGHENDYLIIPVAHMTSLWDMGRNWMAAVTELLPMIPWYEHGVAYNLSVNIGAQAGQRVEHLHMWVVYRGGDTTDGLGLATLAQMAREKAI